MLKNTLENATRPQKVAAIAEVLVRLGEGCTADVIHNVIDITPSDLADVIGDARIAAHRRAVKHTKVRVPAGMAA